MDQKKPSVGRIVHYVSYEAPDSSTCSAAIVTEANTSDTVGLVALNATGMLFNRTVTHDEQQRRGGTWHWPERV